jgi:DNA-binding Lrp family transcriptional regulator
MGGAVSLCAMAVPEKNFDLIAERVNAFPQVAHNYQRDHELNMWFVLATETPQRIDAVIAEIETETGLDVINMPKQEEYFIGLRLAV